MSLGESLQKVARYDESSSKKLSTKKYFFQTSKQIYSSAKKWIHDLPVCYTELIIVKI